MTESQTQPVAVVKGRNKKRQRGAVTVELGLILPLFALLFIGVIDMSRAMLAYSTLTHASQKAARYACVRSTSSDNPASAAQIKSRALQHIVGLNTSEVDVNTTYLPTNAPGGVVQVQLNYAFEPLTPFMPFENINLSGSSQMNISN
jgi:Flp pilus assembly protein TadG